MIGALIIASLALCGLLAFVLLGGVRNLSEGLQVGGAAAFFLMKGAFAWLIRRRAAQPLSAAVLPPREWQILASGYFVGTLLFVSSALLASEPLWSWVGAIGSAAIGWTYFVISRQAAGKDEAA